MTLPTKKLEKKLILRGYDYICGVDEVGMGSLAGPVVVCAVLFKKKFYQKNYRELSGIRDSKLLRPAQRELFFNRLKQIPRFRFAISYCYPETIDRINIYRAARLAMKRAVEKILKSATLSFYHDRGKMIVSKKRRHKKIVVLVDGPAKIAGINLPQLPIIKGDRRVFAIACASILAKVRRDKMMIYYAKRFPGYGFEKHKGYGTKYHRIQLTTLGPSCIHRFSFAPVMKLG